MSRARLSFALLGVLAFAGMVSGCAVLRVDVDVYKGPLANHEEVQLQQMATMAVGAKPLLIELRDTLLWEKGCNDEGNPVEAISPRSQPAKSTSVDLNVCRSPLLSGSIVDAEA